MLKAVEKDAFGSVAVDGQCLPIFATLDGAAVAVVALADYKQLVAIVMAVPFAKAEAKRERPGGLSTIERDPEVAEFLASRFRGGVTIAQIRDACRNTFGDERTPSHQRVQRFRQRLARCR